MPAIERHHQEQNRRDGTSYPLPQLFDEHGLLMPTIPLAMVVEEEDGEILQAWVFERKVEMMAFGGDPRATAFVRRDIEAVAYLLGQQGYEVADCLVPKKQVRQIAKPLRKAGFRRDDDEFAHFSKELRP